MPIIPLELTRPDHWLGCLAAMLVGIIVQGEAQWFYCCLWLPFSERHTIRYDLNPWHHLSPWSLPALLLAGWGWSRKRVAAPAHFPASRLQQAMLPLSGALGNMLLVGILGSLRVILIHPAFDVAIAVTIQMALANLLIPLPPLALGRAWSAALSHLAPQGAKLERIGAAALTLALLAEHLFDLNLLRAGIMRLSAVIFAWTVG
jgi:hypothetical protein